MLTEAPTDCRRHLAAGERRSVPVERDSLPDGLAGCHHAAGTRVSGRGLDPRSRVPRRQELRPEGPAAKLVSDLVQFTLGNDFYLMILVVIEAVLSREVVVPNACIANS